MTVVVGFVRWSGALFVPLAGKSTGARFAGFGTRGGSSQQGPIGYPNIADDFTQAFDSPERIDMVLIKLLINKDLR